MAEVSYLYNHVILFMKRSSGIILFVLFLLLGIAAKSQLTNIVFTSDVHYGITRPHFRGQDSVRSAIVNTAQVAAINSLANTSFPLDNAPGAGKPIRYIAGIAITGDIANREEVPIQSAAVSWKEFLHNYEDQLQLSAADHSPAQLLLIPGNHDVSNAVGFYRPMLPLQDASSVTGIYNRMLGKQVDPSAYDHSRNKVNYSRDIAGVHWMFIDIWPDSVNRIWMEKDLAQLSAGTPVIIFAHDPPEAEARHFTNPNGNHSINATDKFENLIDEIYKDGEQKNTDAEQVGFIAFLKKHPGIKAYFHGHTNYSEMYTYTGLHNEVSLPTFRADSPMKGKYSNGDETRLCFDVITIDEATKTLTARECFWNKTPSNPSLVWGAAKTIQL